MTLTVSGKEIEGGPLYSVNVIGQISKLNFSYNFFLVNSIIEYYFYFYSILWFSIIARGASVLTVIGTLQLF